MKKLCYLFLVFTLSFSLNTYANIGTTWKELNTKEVPTSGERKIKPDVYKLYILNDAYIRNLLFQLAEQPENGTTISLPVPNGSMMNFRVWQTPVMPPELAAKYPGIKNFTAVSLDNPAITANINYTYKGFNAMIYDREHTYLIDPYSNVNDGYYICYYKKDYQRNAVHNFSCGAIGRQERELQQGEKMTISNEPPRIAYKTHGSVKKTFRMALSCTGEYAKAVDGSNPSKPNVISAMTTSLARVNGILQRELGITLQLISNNDLLVYLDPDTDPFTTVQNNNINGNTQTANQTNTDNVIGTLNYDIGHLFCSNVIGSGIADLDGLCDIGHEARAATGKPNPVGDAFDVDYVVHEIGHQLGAEHTFNFGGSPVCAGNGEMSCAYEPGSGSTIMGYAGLCKGEDFQFFSNDYFHAKNLEQITDYIATTNQLICGSMSASGNTPPVVADISATYEIPHLTPFELEAPQAVDTDNDIITYCWEQYDLGDFGKGLDDTREGPIFRSMKPVTSRWRIFPTLDSLRYGYYSYRAEKLPQITRALNFRLTVRDMFNGTGSYNWSDNTVTLNATTQSGPFRLSTPNMHTDYWKNGNSYTVTWQVANTTSAPVNCSNVDIFLSLDDGATWPITLASGTPNDGSETITVPLGSYTASARVKVKGSGNVFFDMSDQGFIINDWPDSISDIDGTAKIELYPVPAKNNLYIKLVNGGLYEAQMTNAIGQKVWQGDIDGSTTISVSSFSSGVYQLSFISKTNGNKIVKKLVIE